MKELNNKSSWDKVIVKDNWGGWYSYSPSGHSYYNGNDTIKIQGKNKLIESLNRCHVLGVGEDRHGKEIIYNN